MEGYRGEYETRNAILANVSQGLEHLLKLTLWLFDQHEQAIGRNHKIPTLVDQLLGVVAAESMPPGLHQFLHHDERFRELVEMLGRHGGAGKYSALDAALGRTTDSESVSEMWEEMKMDLLDEEWSELMKRDVPAFSARFYPYMYHA